MSKVVHVAPHAVSTCRNCGRAVREEYCSYCGQSIEDGHERTLGHFFHELTHEVIHLDGKIVRTVVALVFQPGRLTEEYWAGRVVAWVRPIRLFLVAAALHLFFATGIGPGNFQVLAELDLNGGKHLSVSDDVGRRAGQNGRKALPPDEQREVLQEFSHIYNAVRYTSPVLFCGGKLDRLRRRQRYFVNHLIAALHFYSFWYVLAIVTGELARISPWFRLLGVMTAVYLGLTLHRLYRQSWWVTLLKTLLLAWILVVIELLIGLGGTIVTAIRLGY